jgi:hypothetical protein
MCSVVCAFNTILSVYWVTIFTMADQPRYHWISEMYNQLRQWWPDVGILTGNSFLLCARALRIR